MSINGVGNLGTSWAQFIQAARERNGFADMNVSANKPFAASGAATPVSAPISTHIPAPVQSTQNITLPSANNVYSSSGRINSSVPLSNEYRKPVGGQFDAYA